MRKETKTMKDKQRRWRPGFLALALAMAIGALILAGCGGGGSSSSSSESSTTASSSGSGSESSSSGGSESETKKGGMFNISSEAKACLKEKGVELPEFKGGSGEGGEPPEGFEPPEGGEKPEGMPEGAAGEGNEKFEEQKEAFEECGVETGGFQGGPGGEGSKPSMNSAAFKKQVKEYAACVRENGYEIAEPNFSGEGPVFEKAESESAAFKKASASCESLLKGGSEGSGSESGGGSESGSEG
jgi:hypothetical protein